MKRLRLLAPTLLLLSCATATVVPLPSDVHIVSPAPGVPREVAAFSGKWTGVWDGILDHILVVEDVATTDATVIYAYGTAGIWQINRPGWTRVKGAFVDGALRISLPRPATVTYRMRPDGTLDGIYEWSGGTSRAKMTRMKE